jgi:hypothetical protein
MKEQRVQERVLGIPDKQRRLKERCCDGGRWRVYMATGREAVLEAKAGHRFKRRSRQCHWRY